MEINNDQSNSIANNDAFVTLIKTAADDREMKDTIKTILDLPAGQRKSVLYKLIENMKKESVPADFTEAIAALSDDAVAGKVREVLKI